MGLGIVFAGGGGKGSYEIGIWKYLEEIGLSRYVEAVSGTSVGALNAALFSGSSYEIAEDIWLNISQDKILTPKKYTKEEVCKVLLSAGLVGTASTIFLSSFVPLVLKKVLGDSFFSREGLEDIIEKARIFSRIQSGEIPCYVTCFNVSEKEPEYFKLSDYDNEDIVSLLLATSAIPVVFEKVDFHGKKYWDGGIPIVGDNVPIKPLYDNGIEDIVVVHLDRETVIDKSKYPNAKIIEIVPSEDLGNLKNGTLDFSPEGSRERIELGYADAKKALKPFVEMCQLSAYNAYILSEAKKDMAIFNEKKQELNEKSKQIKEELKSIDLSQIMKGKRR